MHMKKEQIEVDWAQGQGVVFGMTATLRKCHTVCLQAALLAQRDSRSPGIVVALTAAFNLVADIALIVGAGLGLTGAAVATVATQYLSLAALAWVSSQPGRLSPDFASLLRTRSAPPGPRAAADGARPAAAVPPGAHMYSAAYGAQQCAAAAEGAGAEAAAGDAAASAPHTQITPADAAAVAEPAADAAPAAL